MKMSVFILTLLPMISIAGTCEDYFEKDVFKTEFVNTGEAIHCDKVDVYYKDKREYKKSHISNEELNLCFAEGVSEQYYYGEKPQKTMSLSVFSYDLESGDLKSNYSSYSAARVKGKYNRDMSKYTVKSKHYLGEALFLSVWESDLAVLKYQEKVIWDKDEESIIAYTDSGKTKYIGTNCKYD